MSDNERNIIERLLKLYPDVFNELGGEKIINSASILEIVNNYINKHKWFVNEKIPFTISVDEAFFSWHENVFIPQINEMKTCNIFSKLNHIKRFDLFKIVSEEFYSLNSNDEAQYYTTACKNIIKREGKSIFTRITA